MGRTVQDIKEGAPLYNPNFVGPENPEFLAQTAMTEVTRTAQQNTQSQLLDLSTLLNVPIPDAEPAAPSPFNSYADAFKPGPVVVDSVAKVRRNPLRTDQDQAPEFGLQIPL